MAFVQPLTTTQMDPIVGSVAVAFTQPGTPTNWPTINRPSPYIVTPAGYPPVKTTGTPING